MSEQEQRDEQIELGEEAQRLFFSAITSVREALREHLTENSDGELDKSFVVITQIAALHTLYKVFREMLVLTSGPDYPPKFDALMESYNKAWRQFQETSGAGLLATLMQSGPALMGPPGEA